MDNRCPDVIIGKDDGLIEIYTVDESDSLSFRQNYVRTIIIDYFIK